ncbi:T9SS type B sorting domain-containing protein [Flavobacterium sp. SM15]|uniref:T9SS type B sorting domain-containing protein n=1 Tax=Flavobacterium sp. SM15 TaxID=2908005 RepID=UPI001EDA36A8|nr:T9SS type B sorting domain-containing protein [Flavobacterium sp. SM15]MCG2610743.1 T9SS type B sorting domain-containing protein [Flavobacterium sp. SM15]
MKRIGNQLILFFLLFFICNVFAQRGAPSCAELEANYQQYQSCASNVPFPNSTGGNTESFQTSCIGQAFQGPTWFFIQIQNTGPITLQISQTGTDGSGTDVDFVLWGPFSNLTNICSQLNQTVETDCSWLPDSVELVDIPNAVTGELYVLLVDNYSNVPGEIQITQIGGTGSSNCDFLSSVKILDNTQAEITQTSYCKPQTKDLVATIDITDFPGQPNNLRFNYTWYKDNVVIASTQNSLAPTNTITATDTGIYKVVITAYDITTNPTGSTAGLIESTDQIDLKFHTAPTVTIQNTANQCLNSNPVLQTVITNSAQLNNLVDVLSYQWYLNNVAITGATSPNFTPTLSGDYFVRLSNSPCLSADSNIIRIIANPNIQISSDQTICEADNFILTSTNTNAAVNTNVTYQWYQNGLAIAGATNANFTVSSANQLPNTTAPYYLQATEQGLCSHISNTVNITIFPTPVVNSVPVVLEQCDYLTPNTDGIAVTNLTQAYNSITNNTPGLKLYYYKDNALTLPITDPVQYTNTGYPFNQTVYVRAVNENATPNCTANSIATINLQVTPTSIASYPNVTAVCPEVNQNFGYIDFNAQRLIIKNTYFPAVNADITFYLTANDASTELNPLTNTSEIPIGTSTVYTRIETNNNCQGIGTFQVTVNAAPLQTVISTKKTCESDTFYLNSNDPEALALQNAAVQASYFNSFNDAQNNIGVLNKNIPMSLTVGTRTFFVRLYNSTTQCFSIVSFSVTTYPNPVILQPQPITACGTPTAVFNLNSRINAITSGNTNYQVSFYQSLANLNAGLPIATPNNFTSATATIFVKVSDSGNNGCSSTTTLNLIALPLPGATTNPTPLEMCGSNGLAVFNLRDRETQMAGTDLLTNINFKYYTNSSDALAGNTNAISNPAAFSNTSTGYQKIYVRLNSIINSDSETTLPCYKVLELELFVRPYPENKLGSNPFIICVDKDNNVQNPAVVDTQLSASNHSFVWYTGSNAVSGNEIIGQNNSQCTFSVAGDYSVKVTNTSNVANCSAVFNFSTQNSVIPFSITATPEEIVAFDNDNTITAIAFPPSADYEYSVDNTHWQTSNVFNSLQDMEYTVTVRNKYNCGEQSTSLTLIDYPRFFTPNSDGYNDIWMIRKFERISPVTVSIFNRYGKLLKVSDQNNFGWDGTSNGIPQPADDYWFKLSYTKNGVIKEFKSHFSLKR